MPTTSMFNLPKEERLTSSERSEMLKVFTNAAIALGFQQPAQSAAFTSQLADQKDVRTAQELADWFMETATLASDQQSVFWKYLDHQWLIGCSQAIQRWLMQLEEGQRRAFFALAEAKIRACGLRYSLPELAKLVQSPLPSDWTEPEPGSRPLSALLNLAKNTSQTGLRPPTKTAETAPTTSELPKVELLAGFNTGVDQLRKQLSLIGGQLELITQSCARSEIGQGDLKTTSAQQHQSLLQKIKEVDTGLQSAITTGIGSRLEAIAKTCTQHATAQAEQKTALLQSYQPVLELLQKTNSALQQQHEQRQAKLTEQYNALLQHQKVEGQPATSLLPDFQIWMGQHFERQTDQILQSNRLLQQEMRRALLVWVVTFFMLGVMLALR